MARQSASSVFLKKCGLKRSPCQIFCVVVCYYRVVFVQVVFSCFECLIGDQSQRVLQVFQGVGRLPAPCVQQRQGPSPLLHLIASSFHLRPCQHAGCGACAGCPEMQTTRDLSRRSYPASVSAQVCAVAWARVQGSQLPDYIVFCDRFSENVHYVLSKF